MKLKPLFLPLAGLRRAASRGRRQNMSPFGRLSSRAGRALEALAVTGCLLGVAVGPAAADHAEDAPHCKQTGGTNACLRVTPIGPDSYRLHVGIDVSMGPDDVGFALQHPGGVLSANIWAEDGSEDHGPLANMIRLFEVPIPNGYGGEFEVQASGRILNEDDGRFNKRDELVGKIEVFFPKDGTTVTYETGVVPHHF